MLGNVCSNAVELCARLSLASGPDPCRPIAHPFSPCCAYASKGQSSAMAKGKTHPRIQTHSRDRALVSPFFSFPRAPWAFLCTTITSCLSSTSLHHRDEKGLVLLDLSGLHRDGCETGHSLSEEAAVRIGAEQNGLGRCCTVVVAAAAAVRAILCAHIIRSDCRRHRSEAFYISSPFPLPLLAARPAVLVPLCAVCRSLFLYLLDQSTSPHLSLSVAHSFRLKQKGTGERGWNSPLQKRIRDPRPIFHKCAFYLFFLSRKHPHIYIHKIFYTYVCIYTFAQPCSFAS